MNNKQKKSLIRILVAAAVTVAGSILENIVTLPRIALFFIYIAAYLIIGYDVLIKAFRSIRSGHPFDEYFLMSVATIGAFLLGEYTEGASVMLFYQIGELFQSFAVSRSRQSITQLMDIRPDYANVEMPDGSLTTIDPEEVEIGTVIVVKPGEKIPIDGVICEGETMLSTAALTGESVPQSAGEGDEVLSGCISESGRIKIRTTKIFGESTASKILNLVENAGSRKSRSETFITRFARIYTPVVCFSALAVAVIPPLILFLTGSEILWKDWIERALTFLVISCPCALVISIPLAFFAGIGGAGKVGILIKGSNFVETLSNVRNVLLDKTGTMTKGVFEVVAVHHNTIDREKLLEYAALAESSSTHPIAAAILREYKKTRPESDLEKAAAARVDQIQEYRGLGVTVRIDGRTKVAAGNDVLMRKLGTTYMECHSSGTVVHVSVNDVYAGHILVADIIKESAKEAVSDMRKNGIKQVIMLTGDRQSAADSAGSLIGADQSFGALTPEGKVQRLEEVMRSSSARDKTAFVGEGINDAPVLARADVGIAMGALGADAAIEAADVVLMDDDPMKIPRVVRIARKCMRIVYENIVFSIGVKVLFLILSGIGIANMWFAVFADVGVMVIAVLNAIRALKAAR